MSRSLSLYETYSRQEVHGIFSPGTRFTPQAGTWGLWGIVPVPGRTGSFVFFVTFGKEQSGHKFDEWITEDGVLNWQSQPRQSLDNPQIQQFIHHNPAQNTIHLFLRNKKSGPYSYLGRLAYYSHNLQRERPVWIQWQIIDWPIPQEVLDHMQMHLKATGKNQKEVSSPENWFNWRGLKFEVQIDQLNKEVRNAFRIEPPDEATRFRDWYVEMDGQRVSTKWIFHLITHADYSEFDAPTARNKLAQIGLISQPVSSAPYSIQQELTDGENKKQVKERGMYEASYYKSTTVNAFVVLLNDLIDIGEIHLEQKREYALTDYHYLDILSSTLVLANPISLVASPRLISLLPIENIYDLLNKLSLSYDGHGWPKFHKRAFNLSIEKKFPSLDIGYVLKPIPEIIYEDETPRPVFLYNYFSDQNDWEEWTPDTLFKLHRVFTEPKQFVHSTIPIQNLFGGLQEIQHAVWKSALFWVMLQLIILSDPRTGSVYDPRISLFLSNGWHDDSEARLYIQDEYIGELVDCLDPFLTRFNWVWVNRSGNPSQDQKSILGILRLLLKINIAELDRDGRIQFVDEYRHQLFESKSKEQLIYRNSKEARGQLRETIKELKK